MLNLHRIVRRPVVTEKSTGARALSNHYVVEVDPNAGKPAIKAAIESMFKVDVVSVNTTTVPGKFRRMGRSTGGHRMDWKKAYVRLKPGQEIKYAEEPQ